MTFTSDNFCACGWEAPRVALCISDEAASRQVVGDGIVLGAVALVVCPRCGAAHAFQYEGASGEEPS